MSFFIDPNVSTIAIENKSSSLNLFIFLAKSSSLYTLVDTKLADTRYPSSMNFLQASYPSSILLFLNITLTPSTEVPSYLLILSKSSGLLVSYMTKYFILSSFLPSKTFFILSIVGKYVLFSSTLSPFKNPTSTHSTFVLLILFKKPLITSFPNVKSLT